MHRHADTPIRPYLLLAGSRQKDSGELAAVARELAGGRIRIHLDLDREQMPILYRCLDVFVLASLFEMMPIAVLEALSSGVPVIANRHPVLQWMIGAEEGQEGKHRTSNIGHRTSNQENSQCSPIPTQQLNNQQLNNSPCGGQVIEMQKEGALASSLSALTPEWLAEHAGGARERAELMFSEDAVVSGILRYYGEILGVECAEPC
jgi:glycosyltransferase involved in cell wall biosynthesis